MSWVSLIIALISAFSKIYDWVRERQLISEGEDRQIAKALAENLRKTNYAKQALADAKSMSDAELAEWLRRFEPRQPDSK